jgi:multimeric flavodoxin WrbA
MTAELIASFKSGLLKGNSKAQVTEISLVDLDVKFCTGTAVCGQNDGKAIGECVIKDGMNGVLQEMVACDRLVFASPVYWMTQTALTQRFLERCLPLLQFSSFGPRPRNKVRRGKKGLVIVSTGAPYPFNVLMGFTRHTVRMLSVACRMSGCERILALKAGGMERDPRAKERFVRQSYELGRKLAV